jgi:hypothetical protein
MIGRRSLLTTLGAMLGVLTGRLEARAGVLVPASPFAAAERRNALLRPVALHQREIPLAATAFGAVGDGAADDTTAINNALNAAAATVNNVYGAKVLLPKGQYIISGPLSIPNGVHLCGDGPYSSQIVAKSTFNATSMITNSQHNGGQEYAFLEKLWIGVQAGATMTYGVDFNTLYVNSFIRDCNIVGIPGIGLHLASTASAGPYFIENNWIVNSAHQNILVEEVAGSSGAFCGINFYGNTSEHCGAGYANFHLDNNSSSGSNIFGVYIAAHHIEQSHTGTDTYCMYVDGIVEMIVDNLQCLTGGGTLTGVYITDNGINLRQHYRNISNPNVINPILNDDKNGVNFGANWVPQYSTPDFAYATGQLNPATDNAYTLGGSGIRWSAVWAANGTIQTSDAKLKKDIVALDCGLDELLRLAPVSFNWKDGKNGRQFGLVAQAVQDVIPEAVVRGDDPERLLGLKYSALIPVIINAIASLKQENDALKSDLARLRL